MIFGERVRFAREIQALTQEEFADRIGVTQSAIAQIESGRVQPSPEVLQALSFQTPFLPGFFSEPTTFGFPAGSLLFRSRRGMPARVQSQAHRFAQASFELFHKLRASFKEAPLLIPRLCGDPTLAARVTRSTLGLPPGEPIDHLVHTVERAGVAVFVIPLAAEYHDSFSSWSGADLSVPVIAMFTGTTGDRIRWSIAHELAHLVLHRTPQGSPKIIEKQADWFASEFLLPSEVLVDEIPRPVNLVTLAPLKQRWGVSLQALVIKARSLGFMTDHEVSGMWAQLTRLGWRKREPQELDVPAERPRALRRLMELLYGEAVDLRKASSELNYKPRFLAELLAHYAGSEAFA
jgi:Zn-dependent peptidase ImmA (M78 family)/transcriptional regulator with XRE-family HTH domain